MSDSFYNNKNQRIEKIKEALYHLGVDMIALLKKVALFASLPVKFIQFWREEWNKNNKNNGSNRNIDHKRQSER